MLTEVINTWIIRSINIPQNIKYLIKKGEINRLSNLEKDFLRLQLFRIYFYSNGNDTNFQKAFFNADDEQFIKQKSILDLNEPVNRFEMGSLADVILNNNHIFKFENHLSKIFNLRILYIFS
jgi:hypothetical protein